MKFGSVCSGIEAASVAFNPLGWEAAWFSEIEKFPCELLAHHYPNVPNYGDMTQIPKLMSLGLMEAPDILCGGTPCQAFSVAGKRESLNDARGNLSLTFCEIADAIDNERKSAGLDASIIFWENVPGVLNTTDNAFGCFLGQLAGESKELQPAGKKWSNAGCVLGPKRAVAWRVLDAQYFGVAQRRRRVFVVASARDGFDPAAVLFERDSMCGNPAPSRKAGEETARCLRGRANSSHREDSDNFVAWPAQVAPTLNASFGSKQGLEDQHIRGGQDGLFQVAKCLITKTRMDAETETLIPMNGGHFSYGIPGNWIGRKPENGGPAVEPMVEVSPCQTKTDRHGVAVASHDVAGTMLSRNTSGGFSNSIDHAAAGYMAIQQMQVRRLTPVECERLQGFPDNYTDIKPNGKPTPDGPRYKALGNSWAVPCVRWIGKRIAEHLNANP